MVSRVTRFWLAATAAVAILSVPAHLFLPPNAELQAAYAVPTLVIAFIVAYVLVYRNGSERLATRFRA